MFTIHLNKLVFFSHHGLHGEEAVIGADFEVEVTVNFDEKEKIDSIHQTINYTTIYLLIKKHMSDSVTLLETLAQNIAADIHLLDDRIRLINIRINKLHPPIKNFIGNVGVSYTNEY